MLQTIREHTQGWIAGIIVSLIILSFALWGIHSYIGGANVNSVVAVVNSVDITKEQLTLTYERMRKQAQAQYGMAVTGKEDAALKHKALQSLIDIQVLKQASVKQGFQIFSQQIDNYLQSMPQFQVDGQFSVTRFQEILAETMMSISDFVDLVKTSLLIEQPRLGILLTSYALPNEASNIIALVNQEREINYLTVPLTHFTSVTVSPDKITAYYNEHKKDFMTPEQMNVEFIQLSPQDLMASFNPNDAMLKSFYNENINAYTQPTSWKLVDIIVPLAADASDEEKAKAKEKAQMITTSLRGGGDEKVFAIGNQSKNLVNQGLLTLNEVPTELQKSVAEMSQVNQVSEPIKTDDGLVVLKVLEYKAPTTQSFETVKDKVKETYIRQHAEDKFTEVRDRLADLTYEHPESLQLAAKTLNLPIQTSELFTKDKAGKDISQYKQVRDTAFGNEVLELKNNSDVIQLNPETVIVLRLKSHIPSSLLPLKDVSAQIEEKLKVTLTEKQAESLADSLLTKLKAGEDPAAVALSQQLTWSEAGFTTRYSPKVDTAILETAFELPHPTHAKMVYGKARLANGYAVVALKAIKNGVATDAKEEGVFTEQVQNSQGLLEYELYKLSQVNQSKIKIP